LAVGSVLESAAATPPPSDNSGSNSTTVTLEVNPKQADLLAWADANANLRLALRSPRESIRSEPTEELTLLGNSGSAPGAAPAFVPAVGPAVPSLPAPIGAPPPLPTRPFNPVELIVGDQIVDASSVH
jgi:Flp pilus assembly protein CpaB